jgi:hypothetical protein
MGMLHSTDDSHYVGEYCEGKRHGQGVYTFANGDRYWCALASVSLRSSQAAHCRAPSSQLHHNVSDANSYS